MKTPIRQALHQAVLSKLTASVENSDPFDDDAPEPAQDPEELALVITTQTKASGESEGDDEDDDRAIFQSMTTTLTEATGDQENDPDESGLFVEIGRCGARKPIAYRFSEEVLVGNPEMDYDEQRQIHMIKGRPVLEILHSS